VTKKPSSESRKKPKGSGKKIKKERPGERLEKAVARIQQMVDPHSTVTHNEVLEDRVGNKRQYDVVIRGHFAGRPMLGVIECKDHNRRKGPAAVEAFSKKTENLGANLRLMVSRKGFTKQALKLAKFEHIGCLSLFPENPALSGFTVGQWWYGVSQKWTELSLVIFFEQPMPPIAGFASDAVLWRGKPASDWFRKELITAHGAETREGKYHLGLTFDNPQTLEIQGTPYQVKGLSGIATRICRKKRKWVHWSGDGIFDWHTGQALVPAGATLVGSAVETDLSCWDDYAGEIPAPGGAGGFVTAVWYEIQQWPESNEVADHSVLCSHSTFEGPLPLAK
jgi:hypothetical protein